MTAPNRICEAKSDATEMVHRWDDQYIRADLHDATKAQLAKAVDALAEASLQLTYIDQWSRTGTTQTILARINSALAEIEKSEPK